MVTLLDNLIADMSIYWLSPQLSSTLSPDYGLTDHHNCQQPCQYLNLLFYSAKVVDCHAFPRGQVGCKSEITDYVVVRFKYRYPPVTFRHHYSLVTRRHHYPLVSFRHHIVEQGVQKKITDD